MYCKIMVIGRLGSDGEFGYTPKGTAVCNFSLACNVGWGEHETTLWFRVTLWGKLAESLAQYLTKGQPVMVSGELNPDPETGGPRVWTDNEGNARASYEVTAREVRLFGGKSHEEEPVEKATSNELPF